MSNKDNGSMKDMASMKDIFGYFFSVSNRLQTILDQSFSVEDITMKQWFLLITIGRFFTEPPNLKEISNITGNSYQNVKQLLNKLSKNGYVILRQDKIDKRAIRVEVTEKYNEFNHKYSGKDFEFFDELFAEFTVSEITMFLSFMERINGTLMRISTN